MKVPIYYDSRVSH